jgi:hypothetical protein
VKQQRCCCEPVTGAPVCCTTSFIFVLCWIW